MDILVTGAAGMLGTDVVTALLEADHDVTGLGRADLDITSPSAVDEAVRGHEVVVNAAAWTAVDDAESHEGQAFAANAVGPALLARACARTGARLVHVSSDYVVGPAPAGTPVAADVPLAPAGAYGRSKAAGEWAVRASGADALVLRTAWLYGAHGGCFPRTIARLAREQDVLQVVDDQVGQPTWTVDVAGLLLRLLEARVPAGTYHATSAGWTSWYEFAMEVVRSTGRDPDMVEPVTSDQLVRPAPRPAWSVLAHDTLKAAGVAPVGPWRLRWAEAADEVLAEA
ncbi:dTDP-4-dehydrorhamnose reductase [Aquipuribacter hungaricus]|uniref:dTDP-4-dehydrorhamnose reductase n=1 Tax=Aquipuribacter hungaricus TaxID=545624 RepID=A0ABV7WEG1_9MICO